MEDEERKHHLETQMQPGTCNPERTKIQSKFHTERKTPSFCCFLLFLLHYFADVDLSEVRRRRRRSYFVLLGNL